MADTGILTTPQQFATDAGATVTDPSTAAPATSAAPPAPTPVSTPTAPTAVAPQAVVPPVTDPNAPQTAAQHRAAAQASSTTSSTFVPVSKSEFAAMSSIQQSDYLMRKQAAASGVTVTAPKPLTQNLWNGMSPSDRQAYITAHPDSPEAQGKGAAQVTASATASASSGQAPVGSTSPGFYQPPAPAQASDYQTDQSFIPSVPANEPTATKWDVTPEQTVQGQMKQLTSDLQTNPVYQSLAAQLKRTSAAAGGGNSLMAESAAYNQVIGLAYNIATADAATYAKSAEFNASMANQFGLAEQQFIHTALLSDQNYKQSQVLQSEQIKGNLDSVDRQVAGQLESTKIASDAQIQAAGEMAGAQVASASISADASMQNAQLASTTQLKEADIQRQTTLDSIQGQFQANWALQQGGIAGDIEKLGIQDAAQAKIVTQQGIQQLTIQHNADYNANLRTTMAGVAQIGATPGLTAEQQANATKTLVTMTSTNNQLSDAAFQSSVYGVSNGTFPGAIDPTMQPANDPGPTAADPYGKYGNYMSFPGYDMAPPPTLPLFGGTGTTSNVGQQMPTAEPAANGPFIQPPRTATP